ncbi:DUF5522 domain-containing protein [bacterium]|nr:DUF5522 domain-containing protein [bacterium]
MGKVSELIEGKDFYYDEEGLMVLTGAYLKKRGYCCQSACTNCPYNYSDKVDPNYPSEFQSPWDDQNKDPQDY